MDKPVTLAVIIGAHGVTGEVRLKLFGESLDSLLSHKRFNEGRLTLRNARPGTNAIIARFAEIADRNQAEAMRGVELTVPRDALPPLAADEYYFADLIGLPCLTTEGEPVGICVAVENFGAGDIIEIERENRKRFMVPVKAVSILPDQLIVDPAYCL